MPTNKRYPQVDGLLHPFYDVLYTRIPSLTYHFISPLITDSFIRSEQQFLLNRQPKEKNADEQTLPGTYPHADGLLYFLTS
jgi:hypothetical protein